MENLFSKNFKKRLEMMKNLETPTFKMAQKNLGDSLSYMLYDSCSGSVSFKESVKDFGVELSLCGIEPTLWVSPSDLLIGKVCLKAPITSKCVQALTHNGILGIGQEIEQKYWNEMQKDKQKAIEDNEKYLMGIMEIQKEELKKCVEMEERDKHQEDVRRITASFEEIMTQIIDELETKIKHQRERMTYEKLAMEKRWKSRMDQEVDKTVKKMTGCFLTELERQQQVLEANFKEIMMKSECRRQVETERQKKKFTQTLSLLKHNLECKNFANMMYILCTERRKCNIEKETIEKHYQTRIEKLTETNKFKTEKIQKLTADKDNHARQVLARETVLKQIFKQFQKFIYYALKASPTQAEFLLSMEKMMMQVEENYEQQKQKNEETYEEQVSVDLNEPLPSSAHDSICEDDVSIPRFYFNTQLYKREDFPPEKEESIADNTEIKNLMTILNVSVGREMKQSNEALTTDDKSSAAQIETELNVISDSQVCKSETTKSDPVCACCLKRTVEISPIDVEKIGEEENRKQILATCDSLEKIRESLMSDEKLLDVNSEKKSDPCKPLPISVRNNLPEINLLKARDRKSRSGRSNVLLPFVRDSVILRKASLERKSIDLAKISFQNVKKKAVTANKQVPLPYHSSNLIKVCDSLEILRSTSKLSQTINDVGKKPETNQAKHLSIISFKPKTTVHKLTNSTQMKEVRKKASQENGNIFAKKLKRSIIDKRKGCEQLQTNEDFSDQRVHSLIELLKKNSSTLRLFTSCTR